MEQTNEKIRVLISQEDVERRIQELAEEISRVYAGKELHMICILKGSVFYTCELAKRVTIPVTLDFMSVSSYGNGQESSGIVKIIKDLEHPIEGRDVLLIEDIIDTGNTIFSLKGILEKRKPASIAVTALLDKPERREKEISVEYTGFEIPDEFVVGYGLDFAQKYRNLPYIGVVEKA